MATRNYFFIGSSVWMLAMLPAPLFAQTTSPDGAAKPPERAQSLTVAAPGKMPDMRLWSFGDCESHYPYVNSDEHKECVRVVGSQESRDARAYRFCITSHDKDPAEAARCKASYDANKAKTATVVAATPGVTQEASAEDIRKVKAIASAAVERDREARTSATAAATTGVPDEDDDVAPNPGSSSWSPMTVIAALALGMLMLGFAKSVSRRKHGRGVR